MKKIAFARFVLDIREKALWQAVGYGGGIEIPCPVDDR